MIVRLRPFSGRPGRSYIVTIAFLAVLIGGAIFGQLQQSGGAGSAVTISAALPAGTNVIGHVITDSGTITAVTAITNALPAGSNVIGHVITDSGTITAVTGITNALPAGTNVLGHVIADGGTANLGFVRVLPSSCTQSTNFSSATVGVAITTGTTVTSTTTCVTVAYANNITNAAVTLRLADKTGTPIIWLGGNADFSIPANSNVRIPIEGVTFASGITAIAGTASAINLQINGVQ
jgi:hypothetical protein